MYCKKCGNPLPNEGFTCKFCGAMMESNQIAQQKNNLQERKWQTRTKSELYGMEKINYQKEEQENKKNFPLGVFLIFGVLIILIVIAILINMN